MWKLSSHCCGAPRPWCFSTSRTYRVQQAAARQRVQAQQQQQQQQQLYILQDDCGLAAPIVVMPHPKAETGASPEPLSGTAGATPDGDKAAAPEKVAKHTLSAIYLQGKSPSGFQQVDHVRKRRERDAREICDAGRKLGLSEAVLRAGLHELESLLPDMEPSLDRMRASDWARVAADVNNVVMIIIVLRTELPNINLSRVIAATPKLLLKRSADVERDVREVKCMLHALEDMEAVIEQVPYLLQPAAVHQSLDNLRRWFPKVNTMKLLQSNPRMLLEVEEADLEADPLYGEVTTAG